MSKAKEMLRQQVRPDRKQAFVAMGWNEEELIDTYVFTDCDEAMAFVDLVSGAIRADGIDRWEILTHRTDRTAQETFDWHNNFYKEEADD